MSLSNYLEDALLDHVFKGSALVAPVSIYVALFNGDPGEDGIVNEVTAAEYYRIQGNSWNASSGGAKTNSAEVAFTLATTSWGTISYVGIFDDPTAGNFLVGGLLATPQACPDGTVVRFASGMITVTLS